MRDFIERLRAKPEHVRRRIAVGTTAGITGVVAVVWAVTLVASGELSLAAPTSSGTNAGTITQASDPNAGLASAVSQTKASFSQLLGAVGVATATTAPASITVINSDDPSNAQPATTSDPTVIPF